MDSLTQIVLGAACGEVVLGKKIGNKALLFGAIGGTIPDLDVFIGRLIFNNEIDINAFHRGFMHSFVFAIVVAPLIGYVVHWLYNRGKREFTTTPKDWMLLFFLSIFTHPILDSFTPYGTQLFTPFSDYRVGFNTISVVDPLYTLPFLICLIVVMFFKRQNPKRLTWTKIGIYISSLYLLLTCINKLYVNTIFKQSIAEKGFNYTRFQSQPTIFNNVLWYGIAEGEDAYYAGFYSILDTNPEFSNWNVIEKQHDLINIENRDIRLLRWFSNDYFNLKPIENTDDIEYTDLRYPFLDPNDAKTSVFKFQLYMDGPRWNIKPFAPDFPDETSWSLFFNRIKGE
ncbi:metal-dependent hydrolase [Olleya sp. YS]|uniref:metal-dependent hydrolase n=1 Tax=Olleya sp. YS TaxID=3028318 RepID=UPI0024344E4B|nr:metal-dependent hydrolase [Olleya sp. YS]WGD34698.1 metal-dependent hydrolase [Olleya sp. YS]